MVAIAEITGAIGGLKAAYDLVKGVKTVSDGLAVQDVKMELGQRILDGQAALSAALAAQSETAETIRQLEQQIVELKSWDSNKARYELADTGQGSLAYKLKEGVEPPEPPHWICPNCYDRGQKSIMKHDVIPEGRVQTLNCHPCGLELVTVGRRVSGSGMTTARIVRR